MPWEVFQLQHRSSMDDIAPEKWGSEDYYFWQGKIFRGYVKLLWGILYLQEKSWTKFIYEHACQKWEAIFNQAGIFAFVKRWVHGLGCAYPIFELIRFP